MLSLTAQVRIFAARDAVDFRKSHDGLVAIVRDSFENDPFDGSVFVFFNKRRDRIKQSSCCSGTETDSGSCQQSAHEQLG